MVKFERKPSVEFSDRIDVTKHIEDARKSGVFLVTNVAFMIF